MDAYVGTADAGGGEDSEQHRQQERWYRGLRTRHRQQLALQGWGPALRELGREAETRGDVLEVRRPRLMRGLVGFEGTEI